MEISEGRVGVGEVGDSFGIEGIGSRSDGGHWYCGCGADSEKIGYGTRAAASFSPLLLLQINSDPLVFG